jgi:hypothetical protein
MTMGGRVADAPFRRRVAAVKTDNREEVDLAMMAMHSGKEQNKGRGNDSQKLKFELKLMLALKASGAKNC